MHPFLETLSIAGGIGAAIVAAVILLTLFYRALSWMGGSGEKTGTMTVRGVLKPSTLATVHVAGHETFERVRFFGFTNSQSMKTHLPWELSGMVILEGWFSGNWKSACGE